VVDKDDAQPSMWGQTAMSFMFDESPASASSVEADSEVDVVWAEVRPAAEVDCDPPAEVVAEVSFIAAVVEQPIVEVGEVVELISNLATTESTEEAEDTEAVILNTRRIHIAAVAIENYRSIKQLNTGKPLICNAKANIIVGANNAGKSNILRAVKLLLSADATASPKLLPTDYNDRELPVQIKLTLCWPESEAEDQHRPDTCGQQHYVVVALSAEPIGRERKEESGKITIQHSDGNEMTLDGLKQAVKFIHVQDARDASDATGSTASSPFRQILNEIIREEIGDGLIGETIRQMDKGMDQLRQVEHFERFGQQIKGMLPRIFGINVSLQLTQLSRDLILNMILNSVKLDIQDGGMSFPDTKSLGYGLQNSFVMALLRVRTEREYQRQARNEDIKRKVDESARQQQLAEQAAQVNLNGETSTTTKKRMGRPPKVVHEGPYHRQSLIFAIEEPEIGQHPQLQREMYSILAGIATTNQLFVTTHSTEVANMWYKRRMEDSIILVRKEVDKQTGKETGTRATGVSSYDITPEEQETVYTHLSRIGSEMFFARRVVFVEGPTEAGAVPAIASYLKFDLDSLGVSVVSADGWGAIGSLVGLCYKLGLDYLAICDRDVIKTYPHDFCQEQDPAKRESSAAGVSEDSRLHFVLNQVITSEGNPLLANDGLLRIASTLNPCSYGVNVAGKITKLASAPPCAKPLCTCNNPPGTAEMALINKELRRVGCYSLNSHIECSFFSKTTDPDDFRRIQHARLKMRGEYTRLRQQANVAYTSDQAKTTLHKSKKEMYWRILIADWSQSANPRLADDIREAIELIVKDLPS